MRPTIRTLSSIVALLMLASPALAGDLGSNANPSVSLKGGWWDSEVSGVDGGGAFGAEFAIDNLLAAPEFGKWHHMFSWNHTDHDGLELNSAEWNMHWMLEARSGLWLGAGPGVGWVWSDGHGTSDSAALQLGASAHTVVGHAIFGVETRYQWTESGNGDNWLTMLSVGYRF